MKSRRVVAISDLHCGHVVGLTPPDWQGGDFAKCQSAAWAAYCGILKSLQPIHLLMVVGDCMDGKGERTGGTELLTTDRNEQVAMSVECIRQARAASTVMVFGTPYHAGRDEDWEQQVANAVGARVIGSHEWPEINGLVFDLKHRLAASSVPHGRSTPLAREWLWNQLWAAREEQPRADIIIRGHVHSYNYVGGNGWLAMSLPALQLAGTKYGGRQCSGTVDWGVVSFDVKNRRDWSWRLHAPVEVVRRAQVLSL